MEFKLDDKRDANETTTTNDWKRVGTNMDYDEIKIGES